MTEENPPQWRRDSVARFCLLALGLVLLPAPAWTESKAPGLANVTDIDAALLASSCSGCHTKTETDEGFPLIYGRPASEIREALLTFRSGEREGTVMNRIAKGYNDTEIGLLSDYLAAQKPSD